MTVNNVMQALQREFAETVFELHEGQAGPVAKDAPGHTGDSFIVVPSERIVEICQFLKKTEGFTFDCLSDQTAVDRKDSIEVVYQLFSYQHKHNVTLKVILSSETPKVPTVEGVWPVANWYEREVFDLFGVTFEGHSDLRRILMPDDWIGHPLRKDYKEQEDYHGISTTRPSLFQ